MEKEIEELIRKNKIQNETISALIATKKCTKYELEKYEACKRFIQGFITDLEKITINT